jgi:hypothetical protein
LRRQQHVAADRDAVSNVDQVVDFRACADPTAGRSMVVFAPISTSFSITTPPTCGIF